MKINANVMAWLLAGALVASLGLHLKGGVAVTKAPAPVAAAIPAQPAGLMRELSIPIEILGLSESQVSTIREFCAKDCACKPSLEQSLAEVTVSLELALKAESVDAGYVRKLGKELGALRARKIESCVDSILLVRDVLDEKQIEELRSCCASHSAR